ncbi:Thiol:disulfide interchange protein DsbA precursor [Marinobacterium sp. xm-g-59]|uniref:thiol:disulfide interchange protein DsbA/DsbL n=1 Tax=Marinobacterium sp. xm-g-59 TaxID=2497748 RepID=UPI001569E7C6|nr:thiol:disulfide interchange protein DsbA/DsbL [Marinobacterium sp. xm-g-59]NRP95027.1 Thiol:disulfide interchange protein DsbA precursor [Marinobacterium sp. xm-g-59]
MLRRSFNLFAVAVLSLSATLAHATEWKAGEHYTVLKQPVPTADSSKIEVVEAFGYSCPHCNAFEPMLHAWSQKLADDVTFENMPVVFGRSWEPLARAYYVGKLLGVKDKVHQAMFDAIHVERRRFRSPEDIAEVFEEHGVSKQDFLKTYNSFAVGMQLKQSDARVRGYQIQGVPSIIVNGKYLVTSTLTGSHANMLKVAEHLIEKERNAQ